MRLVWPSLLLLLAPLAASPQDPLLARIRSRAAENLARAPNYTCALLVERTSRAPDSRRFDFADRLRLEVALSGGKELFAWPGSNNFGETSLEQLIPGGTMVSGDFALFASSVFLSPLTTFTPAGQTAPDGSRAIRYTYVVPRNKTGYLIRTSSGSATVGYHGTFLVDAQTLDLLRLEISADDLPPDLGLKDTRDSIEYRRLEVGESDFLLPVSSEVQTTDADGRVARNQTHFSHCHQYVGQAAISFGEAEPVAAPSTPREIAEVALAPGLALELTLETELDSLTAAIGDPLTARVVRDVKKDGKVVVPKGALASGRVTMFQSGFWPVPFYTIGLHFFTLEFAGRRAKLAARLEDWGPAIGFEPPQARSRPSATPGKQTLIMMQPSEPSTGLAIFQIAGDRVRLHRGFRMRWQTENAP